MQLTCPACHALFSLEVVGEAEAARELFALLHDLDDSLARVLIAYLALFRSRSRSLGFDRSARLAREVLSLEGDRKPLELALCRTVECMREKQAQPGWRPLTNHAYLRQVLLSVLADKPAAVVQQARAMAPAKVAEAPLPALTAEEFQRNAERMAAIREQLAGKRINGGES